VWTAVNRVVAIGDVHGDYEQFVALLESARLIDERGNWAGGEAHLVQMGDILNRGPDSRKVMDLLMRLEPQAIRAGGRVHCLIGNHETMVMYGDFRNVSPGEYAAFRNEDKRLTPGHPRGYYALRAAFRPDGHYGRWIAAHNTVIRIDDTVFVHAGLSPAYAKLPIRTINDRVRSELKDFSKLRGGMVLDPGGPLWYRGLAEGAETVVGPEIDAAHINLKAVRIVLGHTTTQGAVLPRLDAKIILTDVGLSRVYDSSGRRACLLIEGTRLYALHRGCRLALPAAAGPDLIRYLKQAAALDPPPSPIGKLIAGLEAGLRVSAP
jgi:hypothetical protein